MGNGKCSLTQIDNRRKVISEKENKTLIIKSKKIK